MHSMQFFLYGLAVGFMSQDVMVSGNRWFLKGNWSPEPLFRGAAPTALRKFGKTHKCIYDFSKKHVFVVNTIILQKYNVIIIKHIIIGKVFYWRLKGKVFHWPGSEVLSSKSPLPWPKSPLLWGAGGATKSINSFFWNFSPETGRRRCLQSQM